MPTTFDDVKEGQAIPPFVVQLVPFQQVC